jgi:hypothetical protein
MALSLDATSSSAAATAPTRLDSFSVSAAETGASAAQLPVSTRRPHILWRTLDEQLKIECLYGYALCGGNPELVKRSQEFLDKKDRGRAGVNATPL